MKRSKIITQQPKPLKSLNNTNIKSAVTMEHSKTSHNLATTVRQAKKVLAGKNSTNPLHSETKKCESFF